MDRKYVISIDERSIHSKEIKIAKGEIVYVRQDDASRKLFDAILANSNSNLDTRVLGASVKNLSIPDRQAHRTKIAWVRNDSFLFLDQTITQNITSFLSSIDKSMSISEIEKLIHKTGLNPESKVSTLSEMEKYSLRILIGLVKNPEILLVDNPISQLDENLYSATMNVYYKMLKDSGVTFLSSISNKAIVDKFPGRYIELSAA